MSKHSFTDPQGKQWTACCECNRGCNGNDNDKCSCGCQSKRWDHMGCYLGEPIRAADSGKMEAHG